MKSPYERTPMWSDFVMTAPVHWMITVHRCRFAGVAPLNYFEVGR